MAKSRKDRGEVNRIRQKFFAGKSEKKAMRRFMDWLFENEDARVLMRPHFSGKVKKGHCMLKVTYIRDSDAKREVFEGDCDNGIEDMYNKWLREHTGLIRPVSIVPVFLNPRGLDSKTCYLSFSYQQQPKK